MKFSKIITATLLSVSIVSASDVMKESMKIMENGLKQVQLGFINNNEAIIRDGLVLIEKGNMMFSDEKTIKKYLPDNKEHTVNTALLASTRIGLDINIIEGKSIHKSCWWLLGYVKCMLKLPWHHKKLVKKRINIMGIPSGFELVIIVAVVLLLFGGKKIPELAKGLGSGIKNFKEAVKDDENLAAKESLQDKHI